MSPQSVIAHYRIVSKLGEGGMGAVYRATDTKLNRDVAIKVLPDSFAADPDRLARFTREAQVLASLNHPNIAAIYGVESRALVMELVDGETLRSVLPLETALHYARQIAEALEAAHEKGIIHRDLKPANIKVTPEGVVKLLDFGLAKASEESPAAPGNPTMSPTVALSMTQMGVIMGTAAYMSPEQAVGKTVDRRADVWAFGVVLFEMISGEPLFAGETVSHVMADVIRAEIDFRRLPATTPPPIRELLKRCLDRDVRNRLRDIGEARVAIQQYLANPSSGSPGQAPSAVTRTSRTAWAVAAVATIAAIGLGTVAWRHTNEEAPRVAWLSFPPPKNGATFLGEGGVPVPYLAVSPDSRRIVFQATAEGVLSLWLRDLESPQARILPETDEARSPFWSPDSRYVAFWRRGRLQKIPIDGGPVVSICDSAGFMGGAWNRDDVILFAPNGSGLLRVPGSGGSPVAVTQPDASHAEDSHRYPSFLPDGRHFLFTARTAERAKSAVFVGSLASKERKQVVEVASNAIYAAPGYILFVRAQTLMAQPFDPAKLETTGEAIPIAQKVTYSGNGIYANFTASDRVLAYLPSDLSGSQLLWYDRSGKTVGSVGAPGELEMLALSPDESSVVSVRGDPLTGNSDLWLHDLARHTDSRLTFAGNSQYPAWSADGKRIIFNGARNGSRNIYEKAANGAGHEELFLAENRLPSDSSRDGRYLIIMTGSQTPKTGNDIWALPLFGDRKPFPYVETEFAEFFGKLSPDGRWLAYTSNESKRQEVYVVSFPVPGGKWQVSTAGGARPVWRRDGKELYFMSLERKVMAAEIKPGSSFQAGVPQSLFDVRFPGGNTSFEVTRDGRFLIPTAVYEAAVPMNVVVNWTSLLKK